MFGLRQLIWFTVIIAFLVGAGWFYFSVIAEREKVINADYPGQTPQIIEPRPTPIEQEQMALVQRIDHKIKVNVPDQTNADLYRLDGCEHLSKAECVSY